MLKETYGLKSEGPIPSKRQMEWFRREKTAFFHFGMNTFTGKEWGDGTENPADFNPSELSCRQWIKTVKQAGFTLAIITAKHHDGFCLWPSKYTQHSIKNSPYKNGRGDIVREFTDACKEYGIKAGIYLSPWDRHEKTWGSDAYNDYYANQLTELMTEYGKIYECWWDGAGSDKTDYDWERWANIVRKNQGDAVIFGSLGATPFVDVRWVGNENGIAGKPCFARVYSHDLVVENTKGLNHGSILGDSFIPAEADVSIRPGWFYHAEQDKDVRSPQNLISLWLNSVGKNCVLLLNLPPDKRGIVNEIDAENLLKFSDILNAELSKNLISSAKVSASSVRCAECSPCALLDGNEDTFYAPCDDCKTPTIDFEFENPVTFNTFIASELIELGHKILSFKVSALVNGKWQTLAECKCMGYKWAEHFRGVTTDKVRIEITDALSTPAIRSFALYNFDENSLSEQNTEQSEENLTENGSASVEYIGDEIIIDLGGIYPYNYVEFNATGISSYEIYIFNGTAYEKLLAKENPEKQEMCRFETVTHSYKLKLKLKSNGEIGRRDVIVSCKNKE